MSQTTSVTKTLAIKIGGSMAVDDQALSGLCQALAQLSISGYRLILVHGGGKDINENLELLRQPPRFIDGLRVTDASVLKMVEMTLSGFVNKKLVKLLLTQKCQAVGISSVDAGLIEASKKQSDLDLGLVGQVDQVNPAIIQHLWAGCYLPVVSPVSWGGGEQSLNVNADVAASEIAKALKVDQLLFISDVPGVMENKIVMPTMDRRSIESKIESGVILGGMIPKVQSCIDSVENGVSKVHILGWKSAQDLVDQIQGKINYGTIIHN